MEDLHRCSNHRDLVMRVKPNPRVKDKPIEKIITLYRWSILLYDIVDFFLKAILEYIRLAYRCVVPRTEKSVAGDVALITGAGQGIGRQLARVLGKLGTIVVCVDVNEETNLETVKIVQEEGGMAFGYKCDVSIREQVDNLAKAIRSEVGDINILINNAGVLYCRPFIQHTAQQIEKIVQTNLMGQLWILKTFLPRMIEMDRGYVVAMSSIVGHAGAPNMVPYSASKFAIKGMMEALHLELRQENPHHNIHLMTVSPFIVDTGMVKGAKVRFPGLLNVVSAEKAAEIIISQMRRNATIVFIPAIYYYIHNFVRLLPSQVQVLIMDFIDTGIDIHYDNCDDN